MQIHFSYDGNIIRPDSDEFKIQEEIKEERKKVIR